MLWLTNSFLICITFSELSDGAQVIIAVVNLFLAGYIFLYQRNNDFKEESNNAKLNEQNIKLQWFKELIIQPKKERIDDFYKALKTIRSKINSNDLTPTDKVEINDFAKNEASKFRKDFIDLIHLIEPKLGKTLQTIVDDLIDEKITASIFNDELKLNIEKVYQKEIGGPIDHAYYKIIATIFHYKAI